MDGKVQVTPQRLWVQPAGGLTAKAPSVNAPADRQRTAIKPKTPNKPSVPPSPQSTVGDEMLAEFGLSKDEITPIRKDEITPIRNMPVQSVPTASITHAHTTQASIKTLRSPVTPTDSKHHAEGKVPVVSKYSPIVPTHAQPVQAQPIAHANIQAQPTIHTAIHTPTNAHTIRYTDAEINEMLSNGYLCITRELWEFLPVGSHVRFFKKGAGTKNERFRPGGFIKKQYITADNKRILLMETIRGGNSTTSGYITYPMVVDDLDEIWKRYPEECFIEIHLIHNSLVNKNRIITDLVARVTAIESRIKK